MAKRKLDPESEAAVEVVEVEKLQDKIIAAEQASREQMISECGKAIGRVQTSNMFAKFATVSSLAWLKEVKDGRIYKDIPGVGSWEKFCDSVGMSRAKVDEDLSNLAAFGEDFLLTCQQLSVGYRDLRKLRQISHDGSIQIEGQTIIIGDEAIPLDADHREDLQAAIENVLDLKSLQLAEAQADIKSKDRVLKDKQHLLNMKNKELEELESVAQKKGVTMEEEAFLRQIENDRIVLLGIFNKYLVEDLLALNMTDCMRTSVVDFFRNIRQLAHINHESAADQLLCAAEVWNPDAELEAAGLDPKFSLDNNQ